MALASQLKSAKEHNTTVLSAKTGHKVFKLDKYTHKVFEQILK